MGELGAAIRKLAAGERVLVAGTVEAVDEGEWTCDVAPEDPSDQLIRGVSLRMTVASEAAAGVFVVPVARSEVLVIFCDGRPKLLYAQKVAKIYLLTPAGLGVTVDGEAGTISLGNRGQATHPAARADEVKSYLESLVSWAGGHTHGGSPAPDSAPPSVDDFGAGSVKVD